MSVYQGEFLGRISMGEYPNSIWRLIRRLPTGDQSVIIGVVCGVGVYWRQSSCRGEILMEVDSTEVDSDKVEE